MKHTAMRAENTYVKSVLIGLSTAILCTVLGAMLLTTFVISKMMDIKNVEVGVSLILFISSVSGAWCVKKVKGQGRRVAVLIFVAGMVITVLLFHIILFGGRFHGVVLKLVAMVAGSSVMLLIDKERKKNLGRLKIDRLYKMTVGKFRLP